MIIVSCCNRDGGIFTIDEDNLKVKKVITRETRGVDIDGDILYACSSDGLQVYDEGFNLINKLHIPNDWHGLRIYNNKICALVANKDTLFMFLKDMTPKGSVSMRYGDSKEGRNHINDLFFYGGSSFFSMFSAEARPNYTKGDGCIKNDTGSSKTVISGLVQPHTPYVYEGELYYCNSAKGTVEKEGEVLFSTGSYPRGIEITKKYMWVGCSENKHDHTKGECGIVRLSREGDSVFIPLPAHEVYGIVRRGGA